jgi:tRNA nucleotidyltransferase/poly(A) polymerase
VISVIGPKAAGAVEVTTFRRDAAYSDGRHPDSVTFSSPEEDASRRDFTIDGLFFDPVEDRVIDFVGGQKDLAEKRIRAIGNAGDRFAEDKLRMLRAVRFAAAFGFALDDETRLAIAAMAAEIHVVSPERIAQEMRRMLADSGRAEGIRLLFETGLAVEVLPEIVPQDASARLRLEETLALLARLGKGCDFPLALAVLLHPFSNAAGPAAAASAAVCLRWKLSNKETERICWLVEHRQALIPAWSMRWSAIQPLLTADGVFDLLTLMEAASPAEAEAAAHCRRLLEQFHERLDPPPLLTGNDLLAVGIPRGPQYKTLLQQIRDAQLDEQVRTKEEAMEMVETIQKGKGERGEGKNDCG